MQDITHAACMTRVLVNQKNQPSNVTFFSLGSLSLPWNAGSGVTITAVANGCNAAAGAVRFVCLGAGAFPTTNWRVDHHADDTAEFRE